MNKALLKLILKIKEAPSTRFTIFRKLPEVLSLTRRGFFFFTFVLAAQLLLFLSGNIQNFLDENLNLILFIISCTAIRMAFFSLAAAVECIYFIVTTKKFYFYIHLAIFIVFFIIALFFCLAGGAVEILTGGITS